jgi:type I restriction enzyme, S subunit
MSSAQVPEGYKQTEIGVIPEDWQINNIGDISDVKTGPFGSVLHESDYVMDGTPIITVEHLGEFGVEHFNLPMVSDEDKERLKLFSLKVGDIVFSRVGSIDRNALIRDSESGWLFSGRLLRVRLDGKMNQPHYLSYHFHSKPFKQRVKAVAVGQTMPSLNTQILKGIQIVLPPEEEQQTIAQALSDVDALIASLDKLIAKQRHLKTAAMQQLLTGKMRSPGFGERKGYKQTEIGVIPDDWEVNPLSYLIEKLEAGVSVNSIEEDNGEYGHEQSVLKTSSVFNGKFFPNECKKILPKDIGRAKLNPQKDTIIISRMNTPALVGECGYVGEDNNGLFLPDRLWITRFKKDGLIDVRWLAYTLNYGAFKKAIKDTATGTSGSMKNIAKDGFLKIVIPYPKEKEQRAIATVLSDMDTAIAALETRRAKTQAIKQGMMQELLTGRTRLV